MLTILYKKFKVDDSKVIKEHPDETKFISGQETMKAISKKETKKNLVRQETTNYKFLLKKQVTRITGGCQETKKDHRERKNIMS